MSSIQHTDAPLTGRTGTIHSIQRSAGGVPKLGIAVGEVTRLGLRGDAHNDARNHGGPDRALCLYTIEQIERLRAEGHIVTAGALGENVTLRGIALPLLEPSVRLAFGDDVVIEVTTFTTPCLTIRHCFADGKFTRISPKTHPGESRVYARVLREGTIRPGDIARILLP